ncbi:MAG: phosphatase PAP2 family protein [Thermoguttaceae bacterium]
MRSAISLPGRLDRAPRRGLIPEILVPAVLLLAACAALPLDFAIGRWAAQGGCPGFFRELLEAVEPFGNGNGVFYIVLAVVALDWIRRRASFRILATAFGAGLAADLVKLTIERTRPCAFTFQGTIWDTFVGLFPMTGAGSGGQSFPSAHTATAVGLAAALAWQYPRARVFFFTMAALVATQRVTGGAHFLSDALCGAAVGSVVATFTLHHGRLAAWFDRFEAQTPSSSDRQLQVSPSKQVA